MFFKRGGRKIKIEVRVSFVVDWIDSCFLRERLNLIVFKGVVVFEERSSWKGSEGVGGFGEVIVLVWIL